MRPCSGISPSRDLAQSYDALVIGAGIGGLICANLLARAGLKVLLVEQHYVVGGYCSTFRRRGYTFDAASHFYPLLGNRSTMTGGLLAELGVETQWVKMDPVDQFHLPDGSHFSVPAEFDSYLALLMDRFPDERQQLERFFQLARKLYLLGALRHFRGVPTERLRPYEQLTLRDAMEQHFRSPQLKLLLTADCPHWGSPPNRTSLVFDSMLRLSYFMGNYYPRGGSQAFADELARRFEERGGHIALKSSVVRIVVKDPVATAVELEKGGCSCDTPERCSPSRIVWEKEIDTIKIHEGDAITSDGQEVFNLLEERGIDNVVVIGVHTNRCVLGRPFGIRQMVYLGKNVVLCRDLTDSYHRDPGHHFEGLDQIIGHVEKYWCPTITSESLTGQPPFRFRGIE